MDLHEFQGKELFRSVGLSTPHGRVAETPDEAAAAAAGRRFLYVMERFHQVRGYFGGNQPADTDRVRGFRGAGRQVLCRRKLPISVSYTHLRAHETDSYLVCRLLLEKKN